MFLLIPVQENNRIIHRQCQLEHDRDRIGDKRNRTEEKVRAHVNDGRRQKRDQQHRYFRVRLCCQKQYRHYNDSDQHRDRVHLLSDQLRLRISETCSQIIVITLQTLL